VIIRAGTVPEEAQTPRPLVLQRVINVEEHTPNISLTAVRIWGHHDRVVNAGCDRVYYVIDGAGRFQVGDGAPVEAVGPGDFVFIRKGVPYEFDGEMRYLVINGPAFTAGSDQVLPPAFPVETQGGQP
jgi:mannose-6-phosphate isomerase-like protein (cupin superfamily)